MKLRRGQSPPSARSEWGHDPQPQAPGFTSPMTLTQRETETRQGSLPMTQPGSGGWTRAERATLGHAADAENSGHTEGALQRRNWRRLPAEPHRDCCPRTQRPATRTDGEDRASLSQHPEDTGT